MSDVDILERMRELSHRARALGLRPDCFRLGESEVEEFAKATRDVVIVHDPAAEHLVPGIIAKFDGVPVKAVHGEGLVLAMRREASQL